MFKDFRIVQETGQAAKDNCSHPLTPTLSPATGKRELERSCASLFPLGLTVSRLHPRYQQDWFGAKSRRGVLSSHRITPWAWNQTKSFKPCKGAILLA